MTEQLDTPVCSCGAPADSGSSRRECVPCFQERIRSLSIDYHPTASIDGGRTMGLPADRRWARRLERYAETRRQGIQPETTWPDAVDFALEQSDKTGRAFRADEASLAVG